MKYGEIFWGEVKIGEFKGGGGYKQNGNDSRRQKIKATCGYYI